MSEPFELVNLNERFPGRFESDRRAGGDDNRGGGNPPGPPGDDELKSRVEALEKALPDIRERMVRVETKLDGIEKNMITKADLGDFKATIAGDFGAFKTSVASDIGGLKTSVAENFNSQTKWIVATLAVLASIAFAAARLMH